MIANLFQLKGSRKLFGIFVLGTGAMIVGMPAFGATPAGQTPATQASQHELIPGAERLTPTERDGYRRRMEQAATPEEKSRIRTEYAKAADKREAAPALIGDAKRGAQLHGVCFSCHGIERYVAPVTSLTASFFDSLIRASGLSDEPPAPPTRFKGRIKSLDALRDAVARRNEFLSPKMTPQEVEDVVAYLNATYYRFPQQTRAAQEGSQRR